MNKQRKKWLTRIIVWLATEILLNLVGLDELADFSEFVFEKNIIVSSRLLD